MTSMRCARRCLSGKHFQKWNRSRWWIWRASSARAEEYRRRVRPYWNCRRKRKSKKSVRNLPPLSATKVTPNLLRAEVPSTRSRGSSSGPPSLPAGRQAWRTRLVVRLRGAFSFTFRGTHPPIFFNEFAKAGRRARGRKPRGFPFALTKKDQKSILVSLSLCFPSRLPEIQRISESQWKDHGEGRNPRVSAVLRCLVSPRDRARFPGEDL